MPTSDNNSSVHTPIALRSLYGNRPGRMLRYLLTKPLLSICAGWFCDTPISSVFIKNFIQAHNINMNEATEPVDSYRTFNDFFIRKLKKDARPIAPGDEIITSPADGTILTIENISPTTLFPVKELLFDLEHFLRDSSLAQEYVGGTLMLIRLAPWDYHRFHFPCSGIMEDPHRISGIYESVHPFVYQSGVQPLTENVRHRYILHSTHFDDIIVMSVGALCVGRIKETYIPGQLHQKGDEMGYFCFGGSTIVLIFKSGQITLEPSVILYSAQGQEMPIKMGQVIAYKKRSL